uniref:Tyrosine-protein phosphatase domain-containing protein n=1 Tax=Rodentolepis nana TaxID=102285 RepID=A0A0R3TXX1_RODNA
LAKPTAFDYTDPEVIGEDIFKDLLPLKTLKASSVYSEKKADFLRKVLADVEEKDTNLSSFLSSLNLDPNELLKPDSGLPQALLDQCAKFNAMERSPESQLTAQMSALVDISVEVESDLEELSNAIQKTQERLNAALASFNYFRYKLLYFQSKAPESEINQIKLQLNKVIDRHGKFTAAEAQAKESNTRLHEALTEHLKILHILTRTPEEIEATLPNANDLISDSELLEGLDEAARILSKVEEMRAQRTRMLEKLRADLQADDVTQELLATNTKEERNALFQRHLDVHQKAVDLLNLNLTAQENISKALIDAHATVGVKKHDILKRRQQRLEEIDDLVRSGEAYDDLILKCNEGQAFYQDISERLVALHVDLDEINSSIDDLGRKNTIQPSVPSQQPTSAFSVPLPASIPPADTASKGPPKLRDVLRARAAAAQNDAKKQPNASVQIPPAIAPGAQPYWPPSPPTQVPQLNSATSNTAPPAGVNPTQPSPAPDPTGQSQQRQFMQSSQMLGYPGSCYQSPYFSCIQYPSSSPLPQSNQAIGQRPQHFPSVPGYRPAVPPLQQNLSSISQSGSQSSLPGMINQICRPLAPVVQQNSSPLPQSSSQGSLGGMVNQSQQQYRPTVPPVQQNLSPIPQSGSQTSLPRMPSQPQMHCSSNTSPFQHEFSVPVQPAYPQVRNPTPVQPVPAMLDQQRQQYKAVVPTMQPPISQPIRSTSPMSQPIQFKPSGLPPNSTQSATRAPLKFSEMMSLTQHRVPSPSFPRPMTQPIVQPPLTVAQSKSVIPDTTSTQTATTYAQKMKFSEMMGKGYGTVTSTSISQPFRPPPPVIPQPNGNKQVPPQQPPQVYMPYARFGVPNYNQVYYAGQQYPYAYQQPGMTPVYNPSPIATLHPHQQQNGAPAVPKEKLKEEVEKSVAGTSNPKEVRKEAPIPVAEVKTSNLFEEVLPEDTTPLPLVLPEPTAAGFVPESATSLDSINTPQDHGKEPITPTADLEVQRREKHLRAIYDTSETGLVSTHGESTKSVPTSSSSLNLDSLSDQLALNRFIDATERLLTWIETMNDPIQSINDSRQITRLEQSWSRASEIASQVTGKRPTQAAARCSASKNRHHECMAYDFNRVQLKHDSSSKKDDYINASNLDFVSSLGEWCPRYILTQAPLPNTVVDFWNMIFDQACELVIMALPPRHRNSILPSSLDPSESYAEGAYGDPASSLRVPQHLPPMKVGSRIHVGTGNLALEIRLQAIELTRPDSVSLQSPSVDSISKSTCIERILTLRNCESQQTRTVVHLCYSGPTPNASDPGSIASFTAFVQMAVNFYKQQRSLTHPIAVVSEDGGGLGGVFVASSVAILHAEVLGRIADVCELAGRLCQQRKGALNQSNQLGAIYTIVGLAAKQSLSRRDIIVGPSSSKSRNASTSNDIPSEVSKSFKKNGPSKPEDFTSSLFSDQHLQLSDMMSALGFAENKPEKKLQENKEKMQEVHENEPETEINGVFKDLPSHLVDLSLSDRSTNESPNNRRHYLARDFTDAEYRESRDCLAADKNPFGDLDPLNQVIMRNDN